jgi:hypothetical protein
VDHPHVPLPVGQGLFQVAVRITDGNSARPRCLGAPVLFDAVALLAKGRVECPDALVLCGARQLLVLADRAGETGRAAPDEHDPKLLLGCDHAAAERLDRALRRIERDSGLVEHDVLPRRRAHRWRREHERCEDA